MGIIIECAVCVHMSMCSVLDGMQVCRAAPTCLGSFLGLRSMCQRAAATPADLTMLLCRAQRPCWMRQN